jgi:hypothetical protein
MNNPIEKDLLPRLRALGFILLFFGILSLGWSLFYSPYPHAAMAQIVEGEESEITAGLSEASKERPLNLYIVSAIFSAVGCACLSVTWKKKRGTRD